MTTLNKATSEALWNDLRPALARAWAAYEQLHGIPASAWPEQEKALFDLAPRLYRDYRHGLTPAMEHGAARSALVDVVSEHLKKWGRPVTLKDLEDYLQAKPQG